jgi:hypothetical protein
MVENIDVEGTRAPRAAAAAPCVPLDSLEKPE